MSATKISSSTLSLNPGSARDLSCDCCVALGSTIVGSAPRPRSRESGLSTSNSSSGDRSDYICEWVAPTLCLNTEKVFIEEVVGSNCNLDVGIHNRALCFTRVPLGSSNNFAVASNGATMGTTAITFARKTMNLLLANKVLLGLQVLAIWIFASILEGLANLGTASTTLIATIVATLGSLGAIWLKGKLDKRNQEIDRLRDEADQDDQSYQGSVDKISAMLTSYRTHIDTMMADHLSRVEAFYRVQLEAKDTTIKQRDAVIEVQAALLKEQAGIDIRHAGSS